MSTNSDFIKDALRLISVIGEGDTPSAEQGADGLIVINAVVSGLAGDGINLGIAPQSSTTADLDIPYEYVGGFKAILAVYLQPYYPAKQVPPSVSAQADACYVRMLRDSINISSTPSRMNHLPRGDGQLYSRAGSNILNG